MQIEDGRKSSTLGVLTSTRSFFLCGCLCASRVNSDPSFQDNTDIQMYTPENKHGT